MNKEIMSAALKNAGYYYDMTTATLYMTAEFEKNSNTYGSNHWSEYKIDDIEYIMNEMYLVFLHGTP